MRSPHILLALGKNSDWLEAYSVLQDFPTASLTCLFIENERNDRRSMEQLFAYLCNTGRPFELLGFPTKQEWIAAVRSRAATLGDGDVLAAPFLRYRHVWSLLKKSTNDLGSLLGSLPEGVLSVQLSDCLPDSFGPAGYALGFRRPSWKSPLMVVLDCWFASRLKADRCYFPMFPKISNRFVRHSLSPHAPVLLPAKQELLTELAGTVGSRPLLVAGFGLDAGDMAKALGLSHYWATSKGLELIVDGETFPLPFRICAEEVLLGGLVSEVVGYPSTALCWARCLVPDMPIQCYPARRLDTLYGPLFNWLARRRFRLSNIRWIAAPGAAFP